MVIPNAILQLKDAVMIQWLFLIYHSILRTIPCMVISDLPYVVYATIYKITMFLGKDMSPLIF